MPRSTSDVHVFEAHAPDADLDDLRARLAAARLPEAETVSRRWEQGVPLADLVEVVDYWRTGYDWRSFEERLDRIGQFRTTIDGLGIHFLHRRSARADAKPGDIFTPEIRQLFRRLMYPEVKGAEGRETKAAISEESHELKAVPMKVNARYPDDAPLMTVPPNILSALPKLPEDLEYRFVSRTMILLDTHANLIVDFVPNAIQ